MIYVPDYDITKCAYVYNSNTIRVYDELPMQGRTITYTDYYINSHYIFTNGVSTFSNYSTLPTCLDDSDITSSIYYRNDISDILIVFIIIVGFCWFLISLLVKKLLKGRKYLWYLRFLIGSEGVFLGQ